MSQTMLSVVDEAAERHRDYVADVVHDLQNPLTGLRTQLEVGIARPESVDVESWARSMLAATTEMELLVSDLLALEAGRHALAPAPRDLVDLGDLVLEEAANPRSADGVTIDVRDVEPLKVRGEEVGLRRLLRNLVDNAVRHARSRVWVRLTSHDDEVVLEVVDDGAGVDEVHRERIFERFYRADPGNRHGTGLGLAIVRQVAERHGGSVAMVAARPGEGARFEVRLPVPD